MTFDSLYSAILNSKGTLFEEGLRIAKQYGMADFALELQQLQTQRQTGEGSDSAAKNGNGSAENVATVLDGPFELKEVRPGFDSGIGDDSLDGDGVTSLSTGGALRLKAVQSVQTTTVENGVQTMEASALLSVASSKGDKPDLKRKGENLDTLPSRPPSRRSRSNPNGGGLA